MQPIKALEFDRIYNAPLDEVWRAWTEPERLRQWWGPDNVTIRECEVDLRVGGRFYIVMEAGEAMGPYKGTRWPMDATFTVVEPTTRLAYTATAWTESRKDMTIEQTTEITLQESAGKTAVHVKAAIHKAGPGAGMAVQGMEYGFMQQLAKLERFLGVKDERR